MATIQASPSSSTVAVAAGAGAAAEVSGMAWIATKRDLIKNKFSSFRSKLPLPADVAVAAAGGCVQGGALGGLMGAVSKPPDASTISRMSATNPLAAEQMQKQMSLLQQQQLSGPLVYARNFAVMTGVHAGVSHLLLKVRKKEDLGGSMGASFCSGVAFALVSGVGATGPAGRMGSAITTGMFISAFQGVFYKIGKTLSDKKEKDKSSRNLGKNKEDYMIASKMLENLGLDRYEKNFKKAGLTDETLKLLTDSALIEAKIPPGPRLLILEECSNSYNKSKK